VLIVITENVPGKQYKVIGTAFGVTTRSQSIASDFGTKLKIIVGDEVKSYTRMLNNSRHESIKRLEQEAENMGRIWGPMLSS